MSSPESQDKFRHAAEKIARLLDKVLLLIRQQEEIAEASIKQHKELYALMQDTWPKLATKPKPEEEGR